MPSRILRDGYLTSERIDKLDPLAERFYVRLLLVADDFGRYPANPQLLRSHLFPLRDDVRNTDIPRWLAACEKAGLIRCYSVEDKPFLCVLRFNQRTRSESKYPKPPFDCPGGDSDPLTLDGQVTAYSEAYSKSKTKSKSDDGESLLFDQWMIEDELLDYLNTTASKQFRKIPENLKLIRARLEDVRGDVPGIKAMISRQVKLWGNDPKMQEYLRPETLFGKSKFNGYYDSRNLPVASSRPDTRSYEEHLKRLRERIETHPANPNYPGSKLNPTPEEKSDLAHMKATLKDLLSK